MSAALLLLLLAPGQAASPPVANAPQVRDSRLKLELFAESPQVMTPVGIAVEASGRVLCIESHTHFPPKDYAGPKTDRIQAYEDTNGDGRADKITTFYDGLTHTMSLAVYHDGSVFVATRSEIMRLKDTDGDGRADQRTRIAHLETAGNYPHNGLSGFAFDSTGNVFFGFGENLGADYKLIGSDGTTLNGGGEGGNIYRCGPNGEKVTRFATGFWNPFHIQFRDRDLFTVDNDPDSRPPCRLIHVVEGGDYGYRFRNGRRGTHPFTSWNGELPGTLPMVAGTGEAPSGILDGVDGQLPEDYWGSLLVTSWGDHRIERYDLQPRGISFQAAMKPVVVGGENFRPVSITTNKSGVIYISDWVDKSYQLHGKGRIWRLYAPNERPSDARDAQDRREQFVANRMADRQRTLEKFAPVISPSAKEHQLAGLDHEDPFVRQAAARWIQAMPGTLLPEQIKLPSARQRAEVALLLREKKIANAGNLVRTLLQDSDPTVRFVGVQWIAEEKLTDLRNELEETLRQRATTRQLFEACLAALERLDGVNSQRKSTDEWRGDQYVAKVLFDEKTSPDMQRRALRMLPVSYKELTADRLKKFLNSGDAAVRIEAIRSWREAGHADKTAVLLAIANDSQKPLPERLEAIVGLAGDANAQAALQKLAGQKSRELADEARRSQRIAPVRTTETATALPPQLPAGFENQKGDAVRGERLFFHSTIASCYRCHEFEGRGARVGPDLSTIAGSFTEQRLIDSILQPSREVAPHFVPWILETDDGRTLTGLYVGEEVDGTQRFVDANGREFRLKPNQIERRTQIPKSIMPDGLLKQLTDQEFRDLLTFLLSKR